MEVNGDIFTVTALVMTHTAHLSPFAKEHESAMLSPDSGFQFTPEKPDNSIVFTDDSSFDSNEEKKLVRRMDWHIMPLFCIFYFTDYLDRANIGNATLAGIQSDLGLTAAQLSTAISAFYITYILCEVPSNVMLKRMNAAYWLSILMLLWGTVTLLMAFSTNFAGLLSARLFLGAAESGYIPGILYQMSRIYKPREFALRVSILLTMATLSGIVSGPIAFGATLLEGKLGLHGWQYLFIFEGAPTVLLSIVSFFTLFDNIEDVKWLSNTQKALQQQRMQSLNSDDHGPITRTTFVIAITDWKTWCFSIVYLLNAINMTSMSVFTPTLIDGFGFPVLTSQLLTAPPSVAGTCAVLLGGVLCNRFNRRSPLLVVGSIINAIGFLLLLTLNSAWGKLISLQCISLLLVFINRIGLSSWFKALYSSIFVITIGMGLQGNLMILKSGGP
ncbi:major facilitator superfamily domain-containing protein [Radiomyces spectabilis]|uniref:major facilitator superfamily domain-containing protein n=1 Tax=Radiomyces spectabilis TaxID=64574 RepID=UPI002220416A|nr:major facilitator superfamily domain-containing protein [Radiomyces spectabilis]KAI8379268.1 major facilitator superfamily domain-containing protein [Radiomyces spectabilis]